MKKLLVALSTIALAITPLQAQASDFSAAVAQSKDLPLEVASISVAVSGTPEGQGIYLMLCEGTVASPRPANCSSDLQAWLTTAASSLRMGASPLLPVNEFKIASKFTTRAGTTVDCTSVACSIFVRRDHFGSADFSLDRVIPITFAAPKAKVAAAIGSFKNRVSVRVWGGKGQDLAVRIGGRWVKSNLSSNNALSSFRFGGKNVKVEVFVGGVKLSESNVTAG